MKFIMMLATLIVVFATPAEARHRHKHQHRHHVHHRVAAAPVLHRDCNILFPCEVVRAETHARTTPAHAIETGRIVVTGLAAAASAIAKPARYVAGRLVCAVNVGVALAERGLKGTGSALAHSYDSWGRPSGPVPGAVAVSDRRGGGHVAIVSRVDEQGRVFAWNPGARGQGWHEVEYTHRRARYRVAG